MYFAYCYLETTLISYCCKHLCVCVATAVGCYWWFHFTLPTGEVTCVQSTHGGEELSHFLPVDSWSSS